MKIKNIVTSIAGTIVRITLLILAIYAIVQCGKKAYDFGYRIFTEEPMSSEPGRQVTVVVSTENSEGDIAEMLQEKGLIRDALLFRIQKKLSAYKDDIEPGSYQLNTCMNTDEMLEVLVGPLEGTESDEDDDSGIDELNPATDDITGLETGGVLSEEGTYDESEAYEDIIEVVSDGDEETEQADEAAEE